jgi:D-alanine-D-alanine ligase
MTNKIRVAVLMGGKSAERDVSLATGRQVLNALDPEKYEVYALDIFSGEKYLPAMADRPLAQLTTEDGSTEVNALTQLSLVAGSERPDVVFIALHGPGGEDGTVQGFLDTLGIPYTGSGILASALAMDKARCKAFLGTESIVTPPGLVYERWDLPRVRRSATEITRNLGLPVVIKPSRQGSTYGCTIVENESQIPDALRESFRYDDTVLVEMRLTGTEITVAVMGNHDPIALPVIEIVPKGGFFDYQSKYSQNEDEAAQEIVPARIDEEIAKEAQDIAIRCHRLLGCRGMSRTDMFVTEIGDVITMEVNTIPGMTSTSLLPKAAVAAGISFPALLDRLIGYALEKS